MGTRFHKHTKKAFFEKLNKSNAFKCDEKLLGLNLLKSNRFGQKLFFLMKNGLLDQNYFSMCMYLKRNPERFASTIVVKSGECVAIKHVLFVVV